MPFPMGKDESREEVKITPCLPPYARNQSIKDDVLYERFQRPVRLDVKLKNVPKIGETETEKS